MKRIRSLDVPPPGLSAFVAEADDAADWDEFHAHRQNASYRELRADLIDLQHGLCGYCEIEIGDSNRQVEHVVPQSHPQLGAARVFDATNMLASCLGGERSIEHGARRRGAAARMLSCGQKKADRFESNFVDPRTLPSLPSLLQVQSDGRIQADHDACAKAARSAGDVTDTIKLLGLNVERLRTAREAVWRALIERCRPFLDDQEAMREAARAALMPSGGRLPPFFTTNRSFFAEWGGEAILAEPPQGWI